MSQCLTSQCAHAYIHVGAGKYQVRAIVMNVDGKPTAVFNPMTRSLCKITLKGPVAESLELDHSRTMSISLEVDQPIRAGEIGVATLLKAEDIPSSEIPYFVGNDLKSGK